MYFYFGIYTQSLAITNHWFDLCFCVNSPKIKSKVTFRLFTSIKKISWKLRTSTVAIHIVSTTHFDIFRLIFKVIEICIGTWNVRVIVYVTVVSAYLNMWFDKFVDDALKIKSDRQSRNINWPAPFLNIATLIYSSQLQIYNVKKFKIHILSCSVNLNIVSVHRCKPYT